MMVSIPPGNSFCSMVFPDARAFTSATFFRSLGQSRIIGATRSRENFFASSSVGCTKRMLPGSWSMQYAIMFRIASDFPIWEAETIEIRFTLGSVKHAMISRR